MNEWLTSNPGMDSIFLDFATFSSAGVALYLYRFKLSTARPRT